MDILINYLLRCHYDAMITNYNLLIFRKESFTFGWKASLYKKHHKLKNKSS